MRLTALALTLTLSVSTFASGADKGSFRFGKVRFEPADAFAFVELRKDAPPLTVVALTSFPIDRPAVMEAINTAGALFAQAAQRETGAIVFVRLNAPERCGVGGFLAQTQQQIDLGESFPARTVALTATRAAGECATSKPGKMFDDVYEFRLPYDVPVTAIPKPIALPNGGGEPGAAYAALIKAIQAANWDAAHLRLREEEVPQARPKASEMRQYFDGVALNYPKTVTVTGGLIKGDRANLDIRGTDHDSKKITGIVAMKKVSGQWRVVEQNLFFAEWGAH